MKKTLAVVLCLVMCLPGCAIRTSAGQFRPIPAAQPGAGAIAHALVTIPTGARLRVRLADGRGLRGTLLHADPTSVTINPRTRVPEAPVTIPIADVRAFEIEGASSNIGKVIAIGAAAGAAAALGVIFIIIAMIDD